MPALATDQADRKEQSMKTAADASPVSDLCIPCYEHRHEQCDGDAWCLHGSEDVSCECVNDWHSMDWNEPTDAAWWAEHYPDGVDCSKTDGREWWNPAQQRCG